MDEKPFLPILEVIKNLDKNVKRAVSEWTINTSTKEELIFDDILNEKRLKVKSKTMSGFDLESELDKTGEIDMWTPLELSKAIFSILISMEQKGLIKKEEIDDVIKTQQNIQNALLKITKTVGARGFSSDLINKEQNEIIINNTGLYTLNTIILGKIAKQTAGNTTAQKSTALNGEEVKDVDIKQQGASNTLKIGDKVYTFDPNDGMIKDGPYKNYFFKNGKLIRPAAMMNDKKKVK